MPLPAFHASYRIGIDIAELPPKPNIDPVVLARVELLGMVQDTLADPGFDCIGDFPPPRLRVVDPHFSRHQHLLYLAFTSDLAVPHAAAKDVWIGPLQVFSLSILALLM